MSATMAWEGGWVQSEQSNMRLALNMANMAKGGFSWASIQETQQIIKTLRAKVREEKKRSVEFSGYSKVKAVTEGHPAMVRGNQMDGCRPCHNGPTKNPKLCWRWQGTGAPPHDGCQLGPENHLCHPKTNRALKQEVWHPVMCIYILRVPGLDCSILIHFPRIACVIRIFFQICWLKMVHPKVSKLSAAW
jgi:hypothetical protein